jgi:phage shock protein A
VGDIKKVDTKAVQLDTKLGQLDTKLGQLDTKLGQLDTKLGQLDTKLGHVDTLVQARLEAALSKSECHVATVACVAVLGAWLARKPGAGRGAG